MPARWREAAGRKRGAHTAGQEERHGEVREAAKRETGMEGTALVVNSEDVLVGAKLV